MSFLSIDINIEFDPAFIAVVDETLRSNRAELVLLHTVTEEDSLYIAGDYLRARAKEVAFAGVRNAIVVDSSASDKRHAQVIDTCKPGDLVFFAELRPAEGRRANAVNVAAQFVSKGATVLATIHGQDSADAQARLELLWAGAIEEGLLAKDAVLPSCRFIPYAERRPAAPAGPGQDS